MDEDATGDFFLMCPFCKYPHFRHFENGSTTHCDITKAKGDIVEK